MLCGFPIRFARARTVPWHRRVRDETAAASRVRAAQTWLQISGRGFYSLIAIKTTYKMRRKKKKRPYDRARRRVFYARSGPLLCVYLRRRYGYYCFIIFPSRGSDRPSPRRARMLYTYCSRRRVHDDVHLIRALAAAVSAKSPFI